MVSEQEQANIDLVMRWYEEGWQQRNFDLVDEIFSPDFRAVGGASGNTDRLGYKTYLQRILVMNPDFETEIIQITAAGDIVVTETRNRGTHTGMVQGYAPTGQKFDVVVVDLWQVRDGKLVYRENADFDTIKLREDLGFVPRFQQ